MKSWFFLGLMGLWGSDYIPRLVVSDEIGLYFRAEILKQELVRKQLYSGLTTTFRFTAKSKSSKETAAQRIDIRFEPWDEVFLVRVWRNPGGSAQRTIHSFEALCRWWEEHSFLLRKQVKKPFSDSVWQVRLEIIPFSHSERERAQQWLGVSGANPEADSFEGRVQGLAADPNRNNSQNLLKIIFSTSIKREAIVRYRWRVRYRSAAAGKGR